MLLGKLYGLTTDIINELYYNAHGQRIKVKYENGATTTYTYDDDTQRISRIRTTRSSDSAVLQDLNYWYDPVGNITWQSDDAQQDVYYSGTVAVAGNKYTYDALYRLLRCEGREHIGGNVVMGKGDGSRMGFTPLPTDGSAMRPYIQYYSHDAAGNATRTKHTTTGGVGNWTFDYGIDTYSNKLLSWSIGGIVAENYIYDVRGNMARGSAHLYASADSLNYNEENRLEKVIIADGTTLNYQYDYQGQRVKTYTSSFTEVRRYVGQWELYQRTAPGSSTVILERETLHVSDSATRVAIIDTPTINTTGTSEAQTLRYQLGNHLGTASLELDYASQVISYEEYYPFGNTSYQGGRTVAEVGLKRYRYVGKERDADTGFYYIGARYYCPWLCRWLEPDPINNEWYNLWHGNPTRSQARQHVELTASPYEYCYANPIRFSDPSGEQPTIAYTLGFGRATITSLDVHHAAAPAHLQPHSPANPPGKLESAWNAYKYMHPVQSGVAAGTAKFVGNTIHGTLNLLLNPEAQANAIKTIGALASPSLNQEKIQLAQSVSNTIDAFKNGNTYTRTSMATQATLYTASILAGAAEAKAVSTVGEISGASSELIDVAGAESVAHYYKQKSDIFDCSDLAAEIHGDIGGDILELTPTTGKWLNGTEYGVEVEFMYHQVVQKNGYIYDPMFGPTPVKSENFMQKYNELNPNGINIKNVTQ